MVVKMSQMELRQGLSGRTRAIIVCGVLLVGAITSGWRLTDKPMGGHESFVAVTAREMLQSGDWIVPTYNGDVRLQKTPLNYWLVAITSRITGSTDELSVRLPSCFFAVFLAAGIMYFVSRWLGFRTGVLATLVWATTMAVIRYSRTGRPEMSLTCCVAIALMSFYSAVIETNRKRQVALMLVFWVSFSLAMLAKGPAPLPLIGAPLFCWFLFGRKWKLIPKLLPVAGTIIFLLVVLPWPVLVIYRLTQALGETNVLAFWKTEFVSRFMGEHASGGKPVYYYLTYMFSFMLPWVAFVPMALAAPFFKVWGPKRRAMLYVWLWAVGNVVVMSISGGKRMHYILPAMPAMAILTGIILEDLIFSRTAYTARFAGNVLLAHSCVAVAAAIGCAGYLAVIDRQLLLRVLPLLISGIALVIVILWLFSGKKTIAATGVMFGGLCILLMWAFPVFAEDGSYNRNAEIFARGVAAELPPGAQLVAYGKVSSRFVHHYGTVVPVETDKRHLYEEYDRGCWVVATGAYLEELGKDERFSPVREFGQAERDGSDVVNGAVFHKADAPGETADQ